MFFEVVLAHAGQQLSRTMTETLMQIHMHVTHQSAVFLRQFTLGVGEHELLVEPVSLRCLVVGFGQVLYRHRLRAVVLADPVGIRQIDADRCGRIAVSGKHRRRDDFCRDTAAFGFLVSFVGGRVVLKPLRIG